MDKPSARLVKVNYKCLRCGEEATQVQPLGECKEVIVCSHCKGAAVDRWKYNIYQAEYEDRRRLEGIIANAVLHVIDMRDGFNRIIESRYERVLSEDDFNWLVKKAREQLSTEERQKNSPPVK